MEKEEEEEGYEGILYVEIRMTQRSILGCLVISISIILSLQDSFFDSWTIPQTFLGKVFQKCYSLAVFLGLRESDRPKQGHPSDFLSKAGLELTSLTWHLNPYTKPTLCSMEIREVKRGGGKELFFWGKKNFWEEFFFFPFGYICTRIKITTIKILRGAERDRIYFEGVGTLCVKDVIIAHDRTP